MPSRLRLSKFIRKLFPNTKNSYTSRGIKLLTNQRSKSQEPNSKFQSLLCYTSWDLDLQFGPDSYRDWDLTNAEIYPVCSITTWDESIICIRNAGLLLQKPGYTVT